MGFEDATQINNTINNGKSQNNPTPIQFPHLTFQDPFFNQTQMGQTTIWPTHSHYGLKIHF